MPAQDGDDRDRGLPRGAERPLCDRPLHAPRAPRRLRPRDAAGSGAPLDGAGRDRRSGGHAADARADEALLADVGVLEEVSQILASALERQSPDATALLEKRLSDLESGEDPCLVLTQLYIDTWLLFCEGVGVAIHERKKEGTSR